MRNTSTLLKASRVAVLLVSAAAAFAGTVEPVNKDGKGIARKGYDAVGYLQQNQPVKGVQKTWEKDTKDYIEEGGPELAGPS
jgi:hypothetical protein